MLVRNLVEQAVRFQVLVRIAAGAAVALPMLLR